jgi:hypothetical protein
VLRAADDQHRVRVATSANRSVCRTWGLASSISVLAGSLAVVVYWRYGLMSSAEMGGWWLVSHHNRFNELEERCFPTQCSLR